MDYFATLEFGKTYHVYNQGNNGELLFLNGMNYQFFLDKYYHYIPPIADTFCNCLLPNHFLIRIKELDIIEKYDGLKKNLRGEYDLSKPFSNLFNSYSKSFNKLYKRRGKLFSQPFRRKVVKTEEYFTTLVY